MIIQEKALEGCTKLDNTKEMHTTKSPMLISRLYRSQKDKKRFSHSLQAIKRIPRKRFHLHSYFGNQLSKNYNERKGTISELTYSADASNSENQLVTTFKNSANKISGFGLKLLDMLANMDENFGLYFSPYKK